MARNVKLRVYEAQKTMATSLAGAIETQLVCAITKKSSASLAVSGGSTLTALRRELSKREIDWSKVTIALVDERWVAPGEQGSNETFVRETRLQGNAREAQFIGLWSGAPTPNDGLNAANEKIDKVLFPLDVVVLGMGSIRTADDVRRAHDHGADFLVSPGSSANLLSALAASGVPSLPSVATARRR